MNPRIFLLSVSRIKEMGDKKRQREKIFIRKGNRTHVLRISSTIALPTELRRWTCSPTSLDSHLSFFGSIGVNNIPFSFYVIPSFPWDVTKRAIHVKTTLMCT